MAALPIAQWQTALDQMETALGAATRALARAEERWELAVAPSAGEGEPPVALDRLESRLLEWTERLRVAEELAASVGTELDEREATVERWRTGFAQWRELIERGASTSPVS